MLFFLTTSMAAIRSDALKISITLRFVKPKKALFYYSWCNIWNADKFKRWALVQASAQSEVLYLIVDLFLKILRHHFEGKICQRKGPADYSRWQLLTQNLPQCCCLVTTLKRKKWFLRAFFFIHQIQFVTCSVIISHWKRQKQLKAQFYSLTMVCNAF